MKGLSTTECSPCLDCDDRLPRLRRLQGPWEQDPRCVAALMTTGRSRLTGGSMLPDRRAGFLKGILTAHAGTVSTTFLDHDTSYISTKNALRGGPTRRVPSWRWMYEIIRCYHSMRFVDRRSVLEALTTAHIARKLSFALKNTAVSMCAQGVGAQEISRSNSSMATFG